MNDQIKRFLAVGSFAVVGASANRAKFGNKVLRCYAQHDHPVVGVNPQAKEIEGLPCYASLVDVPGPPRAVSVVAPPGFAQQIVSDAVDSSVRHMWFQAGSEDESAILVNDVAGIGVPGASVLNHFKEGDLQILRLNPFVKVSH